MNAIVKCEARTVANRFKWRDRQGQFHAPEDMETRHLFYTIRMIWNHTMPMEARFQGCNQYNFGPHYTERYMKSAVRVLVSELGNRNDMTDDWKKQLRRMIDWLAAHPITVEQIEEQPNAEVTGRASAACEGPR